MLWIHGKLQITTISWNMDHVVCFFIYTDDKILNNTECAIGLFFNVVNLNGGRLWVDRMVCFSLLSNEIHVRSVGWSVVLGFHFMIAPGRGRPNQTNQRLSLYMARQHTFHSANQLRHRWQQAAEINFPRVLAMKRLLACGLRAHLTTNVYSKTTIV